MAALLVFAAVLGLAATGAVSAGGVALTVFQATLFLGGVWIVGTRVFPIVGRWLTARKVDNATVFGLVVAAGLAMAAAADIAGLHAILGAFLAGLFIRDGILTPDQMKDVEGRARGVSIGLLAPVFFVTSGFKVSFDVFTTEPLLLLAVVVVATVGKILGTAVFYLPTGYGFREGIAVGAGMNGRGAVEIIVAELALAAGLIDATVFSILVFMAIFTTATVPIFLTMAIKWLRSRGELAADERDGVLIVGAGPVARRMAQQLAETGPVTLVDTNADHCRDATAAGLPVIKGNALDEVVLQEAGAADAKVFVAATANGEVNLLATRIATTHFGVPELFAALPEGTSQAMRRVLDGMGGELLFGRPVDLLAWDADLDQGRVVDLDYQVAEPEALLESSQPDPAQSELVTLPLVTRSPDKAMPFSGEHELGASTHVLALGVASFESPSRSAAAKPDSQKAATDQ